MNQIVNIASQISTPLGLAGFISGIVFFILKQIIISIKHDNVLKEKLYLTIIKVLFLLSMLAMILGFVGYCYKFYVQQSKKGFVPQSKIISYSGFVYINNKEQSNVEVKLLQLKIFRTTDIYGNFGFDYTPSELPDTLRFVFHSSNLDTFYNCIHQKLPTQFFFNSKRLNIPNKKSDQLTIPKISKKNEYSITAQYPSAVNNPRVYLDEVEITGGIISVNFLVKRVNHTIKLVSGGKIWFANFTESNSLISKFNIQ